MRHRHAGAPRCAGARCGPARGPGPWPGPARCRAPRWPGHDVERIRAAHRVRAALGDDIGDPVRRIRRDVRDQRAALETELVEEPPQRVGVASGRGPHQPPSVMIDHHGQVVVMALVADLIDPDPAQSRELVNPGGRIGGDPGDDRPDGAPRDPHQHHHRALRARHRQPRHLIIEESGMPRAVACPRHRRDHHPISGTAHPGRVGLQHRLHRAQVQSPPPASTLPLVIARTAPPTHPAPISPPPSRPRMHHQHTLLLVELDPLDHGLLDPQQPSPYPSTAHVVPRP